MSNADSGTRKVRDYMSDRMNSQLPPDFVGDVMREVHHTPQRRGWAGWPMVAGLATMAGAVVLVAVGLSFMGDRDGTGLGGTPTPTVSPSPSVEATASPPPPQQTAPAIESPAQSVEPETWNMEPEEAFGSAGTCENLAGLPTQEYGENVAWRIWYPSEWYTTESYLGECFWFGAEPWTQTLEPPLPDEVAIVIHILNQEVTPGQTEYAGGAVISEEQYIVDGAPAIRYELEGSGGRVLRERSIVWVIGVQGELPTGEGIVSPNYMTITTSSDEAGRLAQQAEVLDRMVATLEILGD